MIKDNKHIGYIYKIVNDVNNKIYIGQTTVGINKRFINHCCDARKDESKMIIHKAMKKYGIENFHIIEIEKVEAETKEELINILNDREIYYIKHYKSLIHQNGYNMTEGGNNHSYYHRCAVIAYDKETKEIAYEADSFLDMSFITKCDRTSIKDCCDGKSIPVKSNYIFRYKGDSFDKYNTEFHIWNETPVYQFTLDGEFIRKYISISEAASINEIKISGINNVLIKQNKSYRGYYWTHKDYFDFEDYIDVRIDVDQYSLDGDFLGTYSSISDALRDNGIDISKHSSITRCCDGKGAYAYGYVWRYKDDPFDKYKSIDRHCKPINCYTTDNIFVKFYNSALEAGKELNCNPANITACAKKNRRFKTTKGYKWFYANDKEQPDKTKILTA